MPARPSTVRSIRSPTQRRGERHAAGEDASSTPCCPARRPRAASAPPCPRPRPRSGRGEDRRPRRDRQRVRGGGAERDDERPLRRRQLLAGLAAEPDPERAPQRLRAEIDEHHRADDARPPAGSARTRSTTPAPAAPAAAYSVSTTAIPAPIASPTQMPLRSVERIVSSDIGPSWAATDAPRPNPMSSAAIMALTVPARGRLRQRDSRRRARSAPRRPTAPSSEQREPDPGGPRREHRRAARARRLEPPDGVASARMRRAARAGRARTAQAQHGAGSGAVAACVVSAERSGST